MSDMKKRVFKRKIYNAIGEWKRKSNGQTALLIEGARRIGKSTIVEKFAQEEYRSYILIDFNKASQEVKSLFNDLMDLDFIFLRLQQIYSKILYERQSVIIFDEVQTCPKARQAIKYLVQDGRYDYIETGSLISIKKNTEGITIPSEEDRIQMYPMDYEEFRWALGDTATFPLLQIFWDKKMPLGAAHREAQKNLRLYMLVGGMPQAVNAYLDTNNLQAVDEAKRRIIRLYEEDFIKIDPTERVSKLFMSIPSILARNVSRYVPSSVIGEVEEKKEMELLKSLEDSKTVNMSHHADDPNVGLPTTANYDKFKLYVGDTGLFITLAFWDKDFTENVIYDKLLTDKLPVNLGYVYENLVAQMLVASGNKLFYHTWPKDEKHYYEVDFLLSRGAKLCPVEVKSSGYKAHASLDAFSAKYSNRIKDRYLIYTKDFVREEETLYVPAYITSFL